MFSSGSPAKRWHKPFVLLLLSFFITIEKVELKNSSGEWVTVIRPDKRVDLAQEEPAVRFFNNGRILPDDYVNVRVTLNDVGAGTRIARTTLERATDYQPPVSIKKGTFVGVSFLFDWEVSRRISQDTIKQVKLVVDQDERVDEGLNFFLTT